MIKAHALYGSSRPFAFESGLAFTFQGPLGLQGFDFASCELQESVMLEPHIES